MKLSVGINSAPSGVSVRRGKTTSSGRGQRSWLNQMEEVSHFCGTKLSPTKRYDDMIEVLNFRNNDCDTPRCSMMASRRKVLLSSLALSVNLGIVQKGWGQGEDVVGQVSKPLEIDNGGANASILQNSKEDTFGDKNQQVGTGNVGKEGGLSAELTKDPVSAVEDASVASRNRNLSLEDVKANAVGAETTTSSSQIPLDSRGVDEEATKRYTEAEEERKKLRKKGRGRIRELEEIRAELAEKEIVLLQKEAELLEKDQTVMVLRQELEIERKLRSLLTKEKEKAEEEAALAMGLCSGATMLP